MAAAAPLFPNLPSPGSHALQLAPSPGAGSQPVADFVANHPQPRPAARS